MIEVKNLTKRYGRGQKTVLDDISFTVNDGEILGFLGPNGAGKSTTMNIITGYISSGEGEVTVGDINILEEPIKAKSNIGYLPEHPPLYQDMTVWDYLGFIYDLKKVKISRADHIIKVCTLTGILTEKRRVIKNLSKGYQQRVGLAAALIGNPKYLVLDEPTVGLDPAQIIEIRTLIKALGKTHTIILSSHILPEIQAVCDRVLIINGGRIIANGTPEEIRRRLSGNNNAYTFRVKGNEEQIIDAIDSVAGVVSVEKKEKGFEKLPKKTADYIVEFSTDLDARDVVAKYIVEAGFYLSLIQSNELSLEEIFITLTENPSLGEKLLQQASVEEETAAAETTETAEEIKEEK